MNKIYIDTDNYQLELKEAEYLIEAKNQKTNLNLKVPKNTNVKLNFLITSSCLEINIELEENSNLHVNSLAYNTSLNLLTNLKENSYLTYINSQFSITDSINNIKINHLGKNSHSKVFLGGLNLNQKKLYFNIDGIIPKDGLNSYLEENSKIINIADGDSKIIPNLIVDNKEVSANHSAFIGSFNEEIIWYLNARGIASKEAKTILTKAFLLSNMELTKELLEKFQDFVELINKN